MFNYPSQITKENAVRSIYKCNSNDEGFEISYCITFWINRFQKNSNCKRTCRRSWNLVFTFYNWCVYNPNFIFFNDVYERQDLITKNTTNSQEQ